MFVYVHLIKAPAKNDCHGSQSFCIFIEPIIIVGIDQTGNTGLSNFQLAEWNNKNLSWPILHNRVTDGLVIYFGQKAQCLIKENILSE